jgi:hypothetical protein
MHSKVRDAKIYFVVDRRSSLSVNQKSRARQNLGAGAHPKFEFEAILYLL